MRPNLSSDYVVIYEEFPKKEYLADRFAIWNTDHLYN